MKYRDLILVLYLEFQIICEFFEDDEKYQRLINVLKNYDLKDGLPYQKDLIKILNMSRSKLMSLMHELYEEFQIRLSKPNAYKIDKTEIWVLAKSMDEYWVVGVQGLKFIPRVGDSFAIEFLRGENYSGRYFNVEKVHHELEGSVHKINIHLVDTLYSS